jgi:hypothetical protein
MARLNTRLQASINLIDVRSHLWLRGSINSITANIAGKLIKKPNPNRGSGACVNQKKHPTSEMNNAALTFSCE